MKSFNGKTIDDIPEKTKYPMRDILLTAMRRHAKCSIQYSDYDEDEWTVPSLLNISRVHRILCDSSIRKIQITYEN